MSYNIPAICFSEIVSSLLIILLVICRRRVNFGAKIARKLFNLILLLAAICPLIELCSYLVIGLPGRGMYCASWVLSALAYIFLATDSVLWAAYSNVRVYRSWEHLAKKKIYLLPFAVDILLIVTTPITKLIFSISPENLYVRGPLVWITYAVALFYIYLATKTSVKAILSSIEYRIFPFIYFTVLALLGVILQTLFPSMAFMWLGICIGLVMVHIQWQNELAYRDAMTGMLNRRGLFDALGRIKRKNRDYVGIMADIDFFKTINDNYGHAEGDRAISEVANILSDASDGGWICVRLGGDEFIALKPAVNDADAEEFINRVQGRIDDLNNSKKHPYEISMSIGSAIIHAHDTDTDKFLRELDESMYKQKGLRHASLRKT